MKTNYKRLLLPFLLLVICTLSSCIGLSMDIQMNRNGSGRLTLEYRLSRMLENIGKLDGNESMPSIPVGRADFERTTERIEGLKIVSFSSRNESKDTVYKAVLDFDNEKALLEFLDPAKTRASFTKNGQGGSLNITIIDTIPVYDPDMLELISILSHEYDFTISLSSPSNSTLTILDSKGNTLSKVPSAKVVSLGKKVSFTIGIMDLLNLKDGLGLIFNW